MRRERERLKAELAERDQHLRQMREAMANVESRRDAAHAEVEAKHATEVSRLETSVLRERINASVARAVLLREVRACEEEAAAAYQAATLAAVKEGTTWQKSQGEGVVEDNLNHLSDWMTVGTRPEVAPERARQSLIERLARLEDAADAASIRFAALQRERSARRQSRSSSRNRHEKANTPAKAPVTPMT